MAAEAPTAAGVDEVHILWISEGMSCDGDTVSITAAGQPGIEDVLLGAIPGLPKVNLHNKVLSPTLGGEEFLAPFRAAVDGTLDAPFVLVIEGSIPNEQINGEGYWTSFGNDLATGEPLTLNWWIDRLAPKAWGVVAIGTCATYGGIHAMAGNPTGCMGLADYLGWDFRSAGDLPIVNVPGLPGAARELHGDAHLAAVPGRRAGAGDPARRPAAPAVDLRQDGARGLRPRRLLRAGRLRAGLQLAQVPGEDRVLGAGRQLQRPQARLDGRHRRLPERGRHLHRLHDARLPRQVHAVHGPAARRRAVVVPERGRVRAADPQAAQHHEQDRQQGAEVAPQQARADDGLRPALAVATLRIRERRQQWRFARGSSRRPARSSTCPGIRSPGSSGTSASTRRSTSTTTRWCRARARHRCSAATACS